MERGSSGRDTLFGGRGGLLLCDQGRRRRRGRHPRAAICARVEAIAGEGILLQGGSGVGRVTRPGLDQPVGEWAINHIPRQMIREAVDAVRRELDEPRRAVCDHLCPGR